MNVWWLLQKVESVWTAGPRLLRCGGGTVRVTICVTPADSITRWTGRIALSSNPSGGWYVSTTFLYWWHFRLSLCFSPIQEEVGLLAAGNWLDKCRSLFSDTTIEKLHRFFFFFFKCNDDAIFYLLKLSLIILFRPHVYYSGDALPPLKRASVACGCRPAFKNAQWAPSFIHYFDILRYICRLFYCNTYECSKSSYLLAVMSGKAPIIKAASLSLEEFPSLLIWAKSFEASMAVQTWTLSLLFASNVKTWLPRKGLPDIWAAQISRF